MKRLVVILLSVWCVLGMSAQQSFTLEEAIAFALENNKALKAVKYDIEKSEGKYKETRAGYLPQVDATVDYMTYFGYEMEFDLGGGAPNFSDDDYINAGKAADVAAGLAPGGSGNFDISQHAGGAAYDGYLQSTLPPNVIEMGGSSTAKLQVGQMLFNGQLLVGIRTAKIGMEMASKNVENSELQTRSSVTNAYYNALVMDQTLDIIEQNVRNMEVLVQKTQVMYSAGVVEQTDYDQLLVQLNTLKNTKLAMSRTVQITYNFLRFQLGLPVGAPMELLDDLDVVMAMVDSEKTLAEAFDISNNLNYQLMQKQIELSEEMVNMEKMAYAPTLTAFYAYNAKIMTTGMDMNPNNIAGATLNVPIFSGGQRKHKVDQQKIALMQAETNQDLLRDQLLMQEAQLRYEFISKTEEYNLQKENVEVAKRVFNSFELKYSQGVASAMELTQANSNYLQAESSYLTSMMEVLQSRVAFLTLLNSL